MRKLTMPELNRLSVDDFRSSQKIPVVIILDNIRSQHNIGSVFRTADAFRIEEILLCGITATPPNREIHKTALGATESVKWRYFEETTGAIRDLKERGYKIIAIEQTDSSVLLPEFKPEKDQPLALVFGNEVHGVDDLALEQCDFSIEIPQTGTKHSLNVSVAAGIVVWDILSKL
jgi:tRNA G18 (ribose-2'-O)-methylase SpoU